MSDKGSPKGFAGLSGMVSDGTVTAAETSASAKYQMISLAKNPSMAAPWSGDGPGEGWKWGDFYIIVQTRPVTQSEFMAGKIGGKAEPWEGLEYLYSATVFRDPEKNEHGKSSRPVLVIAVEKSDFGTMVGVFDGDVRSNLGGYTGRLDVESARATFFDFIGKRFALEGQPERLGTIEAIRPKVVTRDVSKIFGNGDVAGSPIAGLAGKISPGQVAVVAPHTLPSEIEALKTGRMSVTRARTITQLAKMLGRNVQFFEGSHQISDGIYAQGDTLYINVDGKVDGLAVAGHEFTHSLRTTSPELYAKAHAAVVALLNSNSDRAAKYNEYHSGKGAAAKSAEDVAHELLADIGGNEWRSGEFWTDVFAEVHAQHTPKEARTIITGLRDAIVAFIDKLIRATPKKGFPLEGVGFTRAELKDVRDLLVKAAAEAYLQTERVGAVAETAAVR